ncbi:MAG: hypothetical protein MK171_04370 [Pirellulales bacterium]|nr:hypothetical protein [Pirellulales bacterium]
MPCLTEETFLYGRPRRAGGDHVYSRVVIMKRFTLPAHLLLFATCWACMLAYAPSCQGQEVGGDRAAAKHAKNGYYSPSSQIVTKQTSAQQKSEARARQRMARLAAYRALGYSPSRPPAAAIPFTATNSLAWKKTGRLQYSRDLSIRSRAYAPLPFYRFY